MSETSLGLTAATIATLKNLEAGFVRKLALTVAAGVIPKIGRVLEFDKVLGAWKHFAGFDPGRNQKLAIFADPILHDDDGVALTADTTATCIIAGEINFAALLFDVAAGSLELGPCETKSLLVDAAATPTVGQVLQYDATAENWVDFTAYSASGEYAIYNDPDTDTLAEDTACTCIVAGTVNLAALDATAQADTDIEAALLGSDILAETLADESDASVVAALLPAIESATVILP